METITSIWGIAEPLIFLIQFISGLRFKYHSKVSEKQFETLLDEAFEQVKLHLKHFGAENSIKADAGVYKESLKSEVKFKNVITFS